MKSLPSKSTANSGRRQKVPPALNNAKRVPPTLDTAQKVPPTLDTAQKVPPTLDIAQKVPPILDTAQKVTRTHWIPPKKYRLSFSCSFFVLYSFWVFGFLFGRKPSLWTCGQRDPPAPDVHLPPRLPTPRSAWSSRTISGLEGNPSATTSLSLIHI